MEVAKKHKVYESFLGAGTSAGPVKAVEAEAEAAAEAAIEAEVVFELERVMRVRGAVPTLPYPLLAVVVVETELEAEAAE